MPFHYKKNNEVPWNYTCQVLLNNGHDLTMITPNNGSNSYVTNISRMSRITHSGHCYNPKELKKIENTRTRKAKERERKGNDGGNCYGRRT